MAAKLAHSFVIAGNKDATLAKLEELSKLPPHKWLPIEEMKTDRTATCTPRQADWMAAQIAKKVAGSTIAFTAKPTPPQPA